MRPALPSGLDFLPARHGYLARQPAVRGSLPGVGSPDHRAGPPLVRILAPRPDSASVVLSVPSENIRFGHSADETDRGRGKV